MRSTLESFIVQLYIFYKDSYDDWLIQDKYKINLKKVKLYKVFQIESKNLEDKQVRCHIDEYFMQKLQNYLIHLNDISIFGPPFEYVYSDLNISSRVKAINSVVYKIIHYCTEKNEKGHVPIEKCINDLLGYRIILDTDVEYEEVISYIKEIKEKNKLDGIKIIEANRANNDYRAIHIYFKLDNHSFKWELQIWLRKYEKGNIFSHALHKQSYTKWEAEIKRINNFSYV